LATKKIAAGPHKRRPTGNCAQPQLNLRINPQHTHSNRNANAKGTAASVAPPKQTPLLPSERILRGLPAEENCLQLIAAAKKKFAARQTKGRSSRFISLAGNTDNACFASNPNRQERADSTSDQRGFGFLCNFLSNSNAWSAGQSPIQTASFSMTPTRGHPRIPGHGISCSQGLVAENDAVARAVYHPTVALSAGGQSYGKKAGERPRTGLPQSHFGNADSPLSVTLAAQGGFAPIGPTKAALVKPGRNFLLPF